MDMRRLFLLLVLALFTVCVWAQRITEDQARERALKYLTTNDAAKARGMKTADRKATAATVGAESIYAFNLEGGGYVIASGDSRALPVLGYSASGTIDWELMPANMRAWLKQYDQAIASLGKSKDFVDGNSKRGVKTRAVRPAIEPLIKTQWYQEAPYWNKVPLYDGANPDWKGQHCLTGCVATAMAQIMNYYQWPKAACEPIPEYEYETAHANKKKTVYIDALPATTFDWDHMIANYEGSDGTILGTEAQQDAVATLMRYCGQSVYMNYSPEFSGSDHQQVVEALVKYFGYKNTVRSLKRIQYSIDGWEDLVYSELAKGRPLQYGGDADDGGHSFICDGYDSDGLFHINWGWGGGGDGYFALAVLNPYDNTSAGSSSSGIGFSINQDAVFGVEPDTDGTSPKHLIPQAYIDSEEPFVVLEPDTVGFVYQFISFTYQDEEVLVDFALGTVGDDGALTPLYKGDPADSLVYLGKNYHAVIVDPTTIEPGEALRLCPMVKFRSIPGADWQLLGSQEEFFVWAGRSGDGEFYLFEELPDLEITKAAFTKGLGRMGMRNDLTLTVKNYSDIESTVPLYLIPYYYWDVRPEEITEDTPCAEGEPLVAGAYLRAGQESEVTYCFKPLGSGTIYLLLSLADGTPLAETFVEVGDVFGSYDDYLKNESYYELTNGQAVYHINIADNPEANIPEGKPDEAVYFYARIEDMDDGDVSELRWMKEAIDYLTALPEEGGDGTYTLTGDLTLDVQAGHKYRVRSYFIQWLSEDHSDNNCIAFAEHYEEFVADETGIVSVVRQDQNDGPYVDLRGVATSSRPQRKGIYIRNGRKVVLK
jgi:hypothetical protein